VEFFLFLIHLDVEPNVLNYYFFIIFFQKNVVFMMCQSQTTHMTENNFDPKVT
jgi:hypothetical protein